MCACVYVDGNTDCIPKIKILRHCVNRGVAGRLWRPAGLPI